MNRNYMFALIAVLALFLIPYVGVAALGLEALFGVILPYLAVTVFVVFFIYRVYGWARSAVPFPIPTTCGQHKGLPYFKQATIDNPSTKGNVVIRMILEIVLFRSLFRNTKYSTRDGKPYYGLEKWLWLFALIFHYAFFTVLFRHLRFFTEPVWFPVQLIERIDSFMQVGLPVVYLSGVALLVGVTLLFLRRVLITQVKYISLASDFFPLFLIIAIAGTGILMRYFIKVDVVGAKALSLGLVTLHPTVPEGIGLLFYIHLFLVCVLLVYFPFSKLMHVAGILFSPTRNMATNTREVRHVNPWNYPVKVHTYDEYEDEYRERMVEVGLPVEKELPPEAPEEEQETAADTPDEKE